jgi:hypothetical protein
MESPIPNQHASKTFGYEVPEQLRAPEDTAACLNAGPVEAPDNKAATARAQAEAVTAWKIVANESQE